MVALSVGEAEYMDLASTGWQAAWIKSFSGKIGFPIHEPIPLCTDNKAVIFLTVNPTVECWTDHIDIWHHYIQKIRFLNLITYLEKTVQQICSPSPLQLSKWRHWKPWLDSLRRSVEWECWNRIMWDVFWLTTEHSTWELYQIKVQFNLCKWCHCWLID